MMQGAARVAGYRIEGEVGRGGMGVVYRATELSLEREVALKLIVPELASDEGFRRRFLRESRLAASLGHPHVLPVYAAGEADGQLYLVMRYVDGVDLKTLLTAEERLPPEGALKICGQVAEALDAAHLKGLVHRDVKPGNVLLDGAGEAYLGDFGLTKQVGGGSMETGELVGTLDYLAPEQIRGEEVDGRTDEYALACVLHECLVGQPPFRRQTEAEVLWAHMQEQPPPIRDYPQLRPVLTKGLAKAKEERYPTCTELVASARAALGFGASGHRRPLVPPALLRQGRLLVLAGALILAGGISAAVAALTESSPGKPVLAPPNSVALIDPHTNSVEAATPVADSPNQVAVSGSSLWVLHPDLRTLSLISRADRRVVGTVGVGGTPNGLAADRHGAWVSDVSAHTVTLIDPRRLTVATTIKTPGGPCPCPMQTLGIGSGSLWVVAGRFTIDRIDLRTHRLVARIHVAATSLNLGQNVTIATAPIFKRFPPSWIALGAGAFWVTDTFGNQVWEVDVDTHAVLGTTKVGEAPLSAAYGAGSIWVTNSGDGTVSRIDPTTGQVMRTIKITATGTPTGIAATNNGIWVTVD